MAITIMRITQTESKVALVYIALSLFLVGRIGFRAISRVLKVLSAHLVLQNYTYPGMTPDREIEKIYSALGLAIFNVAFRR